MWCHSAGISLPLTSFVRLSVIAVAGGTVCSGSSVQLSVYGYCIRPSLCLPHSCKPKISGTYRQVFFNFGKRNHLNTVINWLDFLGSFMLAGWTWVSSCLMHICKNSHIWSNVIHHTRSFCCVSVSGDSCSTLGSGFLSSTTYFIKIWHGYKLKVSCCVGMSQLVRQ